jgi:hypothetical protein
MPDQEPELDPQPAAQTPLADVTSAGHPIRAKQLTWKLLQQLPPPPIEFEEPAKSDASSEDRDDLEQDPSEYTWQSVKTIKNTFGMFREYPSLPTHDPDRTISLADQSNIPAPPSITRPSAEHSRLSPLSAPAESMAESAAIPSYGPFKNSTVFGFMNWMWSGSVLKSIAEVTRLVEFLKSDDSKKEDLKDFDLKI